MEQEQNTLRRKINIAFLSAVIFVLFAGCAYFANDFWRNIWFTFFAASFAISVVIWKWLEKHINLQAVHSALIWLIVLFSLGLSAYFYWVIQDLTHTPPYPFENGLVADFTSSPGGPPRTAAQTQCSLISDSAWNFNSVVSYERLSENKNGFLRIKYHLLSDSPNETYVGIYCPLSLPPITLYDVSAWRSVTFRARLNSPISSPTDKGDQYNGVPPASIAMVLYDRPKMRAADDQYASPTHYIGLNDIGPDWKYYKFYFTDFGTPDTVTSPIAMSIDPKSIYQVGFIVRGIPRTEAIGHLDVDDISFSK